MKSWRKRLTESINQLINVKAVYKTAPATLGLLKKDKLMDNVKMAGNLAIGVTAGPIIKKTLKKKK